MNSIVALKKAKTYTDETADSLGGLKGAPCTIKSTTETDEGTVIVFEWTGTSGTTQTSSILVKNGEDGQVQTIATTRTVDDDGVVITVVNPDGTTASTATIYDGKSTSSEYDVVDETLIIKDGSTATVHNEVLML